MNTPVKPVKAPKRTIKSMRKAKEAAKKQPVQEDIYMDERGKIHIDNSAYFGHKTIELHDDEESI